jgi:hypothetical protein
MILCSSCLPIYSHLYRKIHPGVEPWRIIPVLDWRWGSHHSEDANPRAPSRRLNAKVLATKKKTLVFGQQQSELKSYAYVYIYIHTCDGYIPLFNIVIHVLWNGGYVNNYVISDIFDVIRKMWMLHLSVHQLRIFFSQDALLPSDFLRWTICNRNFTVKQVS